MSEKPTNPVSSGRAKYFTLAVLVVWVVGVFVFSILKFSKIIT